MRAPTAPRPSNKPSVETPTTTRLPTNVQTIAARAISNKILARKKKNLKVGFKPDRPGAVARTFEDRKVKQRVPNEYGRLAKRCQANIIGLG